MSPRRPLIQPERMLTPAEVAALFSVDPKTVTRWAKSGKITSVRTPGGHRRYRESEVRQLLMPEPPDEGDAVEVEDEEETPRTIGKPWWEGK